MRSAPQKQDVLKGRKSLAINRSTTFPGESEARKESPTERCAGRSFQEPRWRLRCACRSWSGHLDTPSSRTALKERPSPNQGAVTRVNCSDGVSPLTWASHWCLDLTGHLARQPLLPLSYSCIRKVRKVSGCQKQQFSAGSLTTSGWEVLFLDPITVTFELQVKVGEFWERQTLKGWIYNDDV